MKTVDVFANIIIFFKVKNYLIYISSLVIKSEFLIYPETSDTSVFLNTFFY